jgi:FkbM family methyltransferase
MTESTRTGYRTLGIASGIKVICPAAQNLITPYVLEEQRDWFEDEIRFMRAIIEPDSVFIDVGANYGLYTLSAAMLSSRGHVWAYEPAGATAECLARSIAENRFDNVTLIRQAVSDRTGEGWLRDMGAPELNALGAAGGAEHGEAITLTTLDAQRDLHDWRRADIVKIDVEGHEANVVAGGGAFFASCSPLVMCEIRANDRIELDAIRRLTGLGYRPFRLVPGLMALAPFDLDSKPDDLLLNLFCCKPDRADTLARRDRLVVEVPPAEVAIPHETLWRDHASGLRFAAAHVDAWSDATTSAPLAGWEVYRDALNRFVLSMDDIQPIAIRYGALLDAHARLRDLLRDRATMPRALTFARIAAAAGARAEALQALAFVLNAIGQAAAEAFAREPVLPPTSEFDEIAPTGTLREWAFAAALDAYECLRGYSSYFTDSATTLSIAGELRKLGYLTPQMTRREALVRQRSGASGRAC